LAAHHDFGMKGWESVRRFWSAPKLARTPGLSGAALVDAIVDGRIKALLMLGAMPPAWFDAFPVNRPFTLFAGDRLDPALADRIDIVFPMAAMLERDGTLTSADRLIGRQRPVFPLAGDARPGWSIVTQIARAMGWAEAFHYERPAEIYREHARLSAYHDEGRRVFTLRRHAPVSNPAYQELTPWRWGELPFDEGRFPTGNGKARLIRFWD
jgi:assimilatory nitrate reductase catalytic subunit